MGERWLLSRGFSPRVARLVGGHVDAKRYLCALEPDYFATLSPASVRSLELQGGPMSPEEVQSFEAGDHFAAAVALRRWDEGAKVSDAATPDLAYYREHIRSSMRG